MDFSFTEEQEAVRELSDRIFTDLSTHERLRELEADPEGDRFDRQLWAELAGAGLLGISLPEADGGAGLGYSAALRRRPATTGTQLLGYDVHQRGKHHPHAGLWPPDRPRT